MPLSPLALAAVATAAVSGLDAVGVRGVQGSDEYDVAIVTDAVGAQWTVRAPRTDTAGAALEAEADLVEALATFAARGMLTFAVPEIAGWAQLSGGGRAVVHPLLHGRPVDVTNLRPGPGLAAELGRVFGSIHELPVSVIESSGLPVYTAAEYRDRRLAEVDEAATTGMVPPSLLNRWESALEDVTLWRFQPVVTHGDLGPEQVLVDGDRVRAITDWSSAQVADPADDLAWLVASAPQDAVESVLEAYRLRRTEMPDPHFTERALLIGELALVKWLLYGVRHDREDVITDAIAMLSDLDDATRAD